MISCPSNAISFGNLRDDQSQVSKKAADPKRGYHALHVLNTRPAVTYLSKVIRGKVDDLLVDPLYLSPPFRGHESIYI